MLMALALLMPETVRGVGGRHRAQRHTSLGGEAEGVGDGVDRYCHSGDVECTAHSTDGEGRGGCGAIAAGRSLLHGDRLAVGYRAGS